MVVHRELTSLRAVGCPSPSTPHALGDTYRAREAVAAGNRRRCPRDPIAPERSKQESESWWGAVQEPSPSCWSAAALTSTAGLDEEHLRLVLQARAIGIVKKPKNLLELPERKGKLSSPNHTTAVFVGRNARGRERPCISTGRHAPAAVCHPHRRRCPPHHAREAPQHRSLWPGVQVTVQNSGVSLAFPRRKTPFSTDSCIQHQCKHEPLVSL